MQCRDFRQANSTIPTAGICAPGKKSWVFNTDQDPWSRTTGPSIALTPVNFALTTYRWGHESVACSAIRTVQPWFSLYQLCIYMPASIPCLPTEIPPSYRLSYCTDSGSYVLGLAITDGRLVLAEWHFAELCLELRTIVLSKLLCTASSERASFLGSEHNI